MLLATMTIYEKIEAKGAKDAAEIIRTAENKAVRLKTDVLATADTETAARIALAKQQAADQLKTAETAASQIAKRTTLASHKAVIDGIFAMASESLHHLEDEAYVKFVVRLLRADDLTGTEVIRPAKNDRQRFLKLFSSTGDENLDLLGKALKKPGFRLQLGADTDDSGGGFYVISRDFDVDHSFATILADARDGLEAQLAEILFGSGA